MSFIWQLSLVCSVHNEIAIIVDKNSGLFRVSAFVASMTRYETKGDVKQ